MTFKIKTWTSREDDGGNDASTYLVGVNASIIADLAPADDDLIVAPWNVNTSLYVDARAGNDTIIGSSIAEKQNIFGGDGDDVIRPLHFSFWTGGTNFDGGSGNDTLDLSLNPDQYGFHNAILADLTRGLVGMYYAGYASNIYNIDNLIGSSASDVLNGSSSGNRIAGGPGYDTIDGRAGNDVLNGDGGDDLIYGDTGKDFLDGGIGNDVLDGGNGNDTLFGQDGNDRLVQSTMAGSDTIDGGAGSDTVDYSANHGAGEHIVANLTAGTVMKYRDSVLLGTDKLSAIEDVIGTDGNDNLGGGNAAYSMALSLSGGAGNDSLYGGAGNDTLTGGIGDDVLSGGVSGDDALTGGVGADSLYGGAGDDTLTGGAGNDVIWGAQGYNRYMQDQWDDSDFMLGTSARTVADYSALLREAGMSDGADPHIVANLGINRIEKFVNGRALGTDKVSYVHDVTGTSFSDVLYGDKYANALAGGAGNDVLVGAAGDDRLDGGSGNDVLVGGAGNDTLDAGAGNDVMRLDGGGDEVFIFKAGFGADVISVRNTADIVGHALARFDQIAADNVLFQRLGDDLQITIAGTTDSVTLSNWYGLMSATGPTSDFAIDAFLAGDTVLDAVTVANLVTLIGAAPVAMSSLSGEIVSPSPM